jgi:hypothetical protein
MPVIFPKLYIRLTIDGRTELLTVTNVTKMARGIRTIVDGTYRDGATWQPGKLYSVSSGTLNSPDSAFPSMREVPVFGMTHMSVQLRDTAGAVYASPDEAMHIPPRPLEQRASGLLISTREDPIEAEPRPIFASAPFTITVASNVCTTSSAMPFEHGDEIAVTATALPTAAAPTPFAVTAVYTLVKLSSTAFLVRNSAGLLVDWATAGVGCLAVLVRGTRPPPLLEDGVFFFRDAWQPRVFADPPLTA